MNPPSIFIDGLSNHLFNQKPVTYNNKTKLKPKYPSPDNNTMNKNLSKLPRSTTVGTVNEINHFNRQSIPRPTLKNSSSLGAAYELIRKERRHHTIAPLSRISGPSSEIKSNMFANILAPINNRTNNFPNTNTSFSQERSDAEMSHNDDVPIVVKVRYDVDAGSLPSEHLIRQALESQMNQKSYKNDEPIILNFIEDNMKITQNIPNRLVPTENKNQNLISSNRNRNQQNPPPRPKISRKPYLSPHNPSVVNSLSFPIQQEDAFNRKNIQQPSKFRQVQQSQRVSRSPKRKRDSSKQNKSNKKGKTHLQSINSKMANQYPAVNINDQQFVYHRQQGSNPSGEVFRPPAVTDIPELSRANLLNMLNQIPDLQGRHFNIEYAPPSSSEGYPFPSHADAAHSSYPEPVVINQLPQNVLQHVRSSNNPSLTAALEASIRRDQHTQAYAPPQAGVSSLNAQPAAVMHHTAQYNQPVQQSRPVSSTDSSSSTTDSSSETSPSSSSSTSGEETDSEETESIPEAKSTINTSFVESIPATTHHRNQYH